MQVIIGAALALTSINLITLLIGTQVLQGIVTPVILAYILILTSRRSLLGAAAERAGLQGRRHHLHGRHLGDEPAAAGLHRARVVRYRLSGAAKALLTPG